MYIPLSGKFSTDFAKTNTLNLCVHMPAKIEPAKMLQNTLNLLKFSLYSKFLTKSVCLFFPHSGIRLTKLLD